MNTDNIIDPAVLHGAAEFLCPFVRTQFEVDAERKRLLQTYPGAANREIIESEYTLSGLLRRFIHMRGSPGGAYVDIDNDVSDSETETRTHFDRAHPEPYVHFGKTTDRDGTPHIKIKGKWGPVTDFVLDTSGCRYVRLETPFFDVFKKKMRSVSHDVFDPGAPYRHDVFNHWEKLQRDTVAPDNSATLEDIAPFTFLLRLLSGMHPEDYPGGYVPPDDAAVQQTLFWLAHRFKNPGAQPPVFAPLFHSAFGGLGKSTLCATLFKTHGEQLVASLDPQDVQDPNFNEHLGNVLFAFVHELPSGLSHSRRGYNQSENWLDGFKSKITEEFRQHRAKYRKAKPVRNFIGWILSTNHVDAVALAAGGAERRFLAFSTDLDPKQWPRHKGFFTDYYHWLGAGGASKLAGVLLRLEQFIPEFATWNPHAEPPRTRALNMLKTASMSSPAAFIKEQIEQQEGIFSNDFIKSGDLSVWLRVTSETAKHEFRNVGFKRLRRVMEEAGAEYAPDLRIGGKTCTVYLLRRLEHWRSNGTATPEDREAHLSPAQSAPTAFPELKVVTGRTQS